MSKKNVEQEQEELPELVQESETSTALPPSVMPLIYCGPAIPGVASHGMLFTTIPDAMTQCVQACPAINSFIVEPKDYVRIKQEIERKGSLLCIQYHTVLDYLQRR